METFKRFVTRGDVLVALGIWLTAGAIPLGFHFDLNKSEWAAWVQAVGSIAAILGSVELFRRQTAVTNSLAVKERRRNRLERQIAAYAICLSAHELIEELCSAYLEDAVSRYFEDIYSPSSFTHVAQALAEIPLHETQSYHMTRGILDLRDAASRAEAFCRLRGPNPTIENMDLLPKTMEIISDMYRISVNGFKSVEEAVRDARTEFHIP